MDKVDNDQRLVEKQLRNFVTYHINQPNFKGQITEGAEDVVTRGKTSGLVWDPDQPMSELSAPTPTSAESQKDELSLRRNNSL